jgi:putative aminopeptidase FrvX
MADSSGPFDYHLTHKLLRLAGEFGISHQRDIFRYYRCDSASAIEAGNDIRTALISFGVDASHGYERIHMQSLRAIAELIGVYAQSPVDIARDAKTLGPIEGFTHQPNKLAAGQRTKPKRKPAVI